MFNIFNIRYEIKDYIYLKIIFVLFNNKVFHKDGCLFVGLRSSAV